MVIRESTFWRALRCRERRSPSASSFEGERLGHDGNGQDTHLAGHFGHDRCSTCTSTTTHAGGDEHHVGTGQQLAQRFPVFHGGITTHFRIGSGTQTLGDATADLQVVLALELRSAWASVFTVMNSTPSMF
jgi:hypothetical protein